MVAVCEDRRRGRIQGIGFDARPHLLSSPPQERKSPAHAFIFPTDCPANPVAGFSKRRRTILPLRQRELGERAGGRWRAIQIILWPSAKNGRPPGTGQKASFLLLG